MICDQSVKNRIKRAQGQMQGVLKMMDSDLSCEDIINQLKAIRSSVDKAIGVLTTDNLMQALRDDDIIDDHALNEALKLMMKAR
jgi:CsoR family transcriptional regulator, copper-sensing transcriptional repressor